MTIGGAQAATWSICAVATAGVIIRPLRLPEYLWAVAGAVLLLILGLIPLPGALHAVAQGMDVYLFLIGMMLLSETARREGLFDWLAVHAVRHARGSSLRLFTLVFLIGTLVTTFLSNDATAVVLTPAVFAAAKAARAKPLPMLLACAIIANAASFVLPISNPANLVLYAGRMPPVQEWLAAFALPSLLAIGASYGLLRWAERSDLAAPCATSIPAVSLRAGGRVALIGIGATAIALLAASAAEIPLGLPTLLAGGFTSLAVMLRDRSSLVPLLRGVAWGVLPLVAGLFILVEAMRRTGALAPIAQSLAQGAEQAPSLIAAGGGVAIAFASNLINNLPAGLIASESIAMAQPPRIVADALLIGVDLGPNLSVTGSLATILWLSALRREGIEIGFWRFLRTGVIVMPPALLLALGARLLIG